MSTGRPCTDCARFAHSKTSFCLSKSYFELFDCLLKPILMYGCEIYRAHSYGCIKSFHLKYMKHILDVKVSTNPTMICAETG